MTQTVVEQSGVEQAGAEQDPGWRSRCNRRLAVALEVLAGQTAPMALPALQDTVEAQVPLTAYDASTTDKSGVRAWTNFGWNITTRYQHAGWLHATDAGVRITTQGRAALRSYPDADRLYEQAWVGYTDWDTQRKDPIQTAIDASSQIVHTGPGADHALRAAHVLLTAWREQGSALAPGTAAWTRESTAALDTYLTGAPRDWLQVSTLPG